MSNTIIIIIIIVIIIICVIIIIIIIIIIICNDSYPQRVYYCGYLTHVVDQIYHANFRSYTEILRCCVDFMASNIDQVFSKSLVDCCFMLLCE